MTDDDPTKRPSRRGWPLRTQSTTTPAGTHAHALPRWVPIALIGLTVSMLMLIGVVALIVHRNQQISAYRNEQQAATREEMREGFCDLLDQFPTSALLDGPRKKYGCGPGIPLDELPPSIRQQWHAPSAASTSKAAPTTTATPAEPTTLATGASATRATATEPTVPARPSDTPAPTQSPLDPLLCGLLPALCTDH